MLYNIRLLNDFYKPPYKGQSDHKAIVWSYSFTCLWTGQSLLDLNYSGHADGSKTWIRSGRTLGK